MDTILSGFAAGTGPKYRVLAGVIRSAIQSGQLAPGYQVPPVRELAYRLGVTPGTVARAYTILTDERLLVAGVGRGTFVRGVEPAETPATAPIAVEPVPHGSEGKTYPISLFSPALPNVGQSSLIKQCMAKVAEEPPSGVMHYPSHTAYRHAREAAVRWLTGTPLGKLDEGQVVLAHGGQNAIVLILQAVLRGRRPAVLVEELAYPGFRRAAELLRADLVPVAMDEHGLIPEALAEAARAHDAQIVCTSPEVHNPTCLFTPEWRRHEIVEVARRYDLQILEDDCYRIGPARADTFRCLAPERSWYTSSISKSLTPSLRIGFAVAPEQRASDLRRAADDSFFGIAAPMADLAARLLTCPELPVLHDKVKSEYARYIRVAVNHLGAYDLSWREDVPFVWLRLGQGWRAPAFCQAAEARGVQIRPSDEFTLRDARAPHAVRIAINAQIPIEAFEGAMVCLRDLLTDLPERINV
jgi:DNA-binding transcriptional MocR family regulator